MTLQGRRALITGAASGIGLATAELFIEHGASVALLDREVERLVAVAKRLGAIAVPANVAEDSEVERAVATAVERLGGLDTLVNAAGIASLRPLAETSRELWDHTLAVNLTGPFLVCRAAVPALSEAGSASIVNIASAAGLKPIPDSAAYGASKAGLVMLGRVLALELAPVGIRVNTVCPGIVETPMFRSTYENAPDPDAALRAITERYLIRRSAEPREIAHAVRYLASKEAAYVTGTTLPVDGGRTMY